MFRNIWDVIFVILTSNLWSCTEAYTDAYTSNRASFSLAISECEHLVETRRDVVNNLEEYVLNEERRLSAIKRTLDRYKIEYELAKSDAANYMRNPLNAFTLIKRLTLDLNNGIKEHITTGIENINNLTRFFEMQATMLPNQKDLRYAALGLRRIQFTYKFSVKELAEGKINGVAFGLPLSSGDCFAISSILYNEYDFYAAEDWAMEAIQKQKQEGRSEQYTDLLINYIDDLHDAIIDYEQDPEAYQDYIPYIIFDQAGWEFQFSACRGERQIPHNIAKGLTCFLTTHNPFLRLAPIKTEQLYIDPNIFMFYDVISDEEIEYIKNTANPKLERAAVVLANDLRALTESRICKSMWISDEWSEIAARISRRVAEFTALSMTTAEHLQVVNYGIGGHYDAHYDFTVKYLSEVEQGGSTAFIKLGLRVLPVKNAAVFWMNQHPSGEGNLFTEHAACPVIEGSKWIATKWIYQVGQELLRPCTLEYQQEGEDEIL